MSGRGFTLLELLLALVVTSVVLAGAVALAGAARATGVVAPAVLDTVRRAQAGVDALSAALSGAGGGAALADGVWALGSSLPVLSPLAAFGDGPGGGFRAVRVVRALEGGRGRVLVPQPGPAGSLTLDRDDGACPATTAVCGFDVGDLAVVFSGRGHFDVFEIGAVSETLGRVTPRAPLLRAYEPGAWLVSVRADRFELSRQPDGSNTLTRITGAGAREPLVDGVVDLRLRVWGRPLPPAVRDATSGRGLAQYAPHPPAPDEIDPEGVFPDGEHCVVYRERGVPRTRLAAIDASGGLAELMPADLLDGPWCPHDGAPDAYDADLFRLRRVDVDLRVEVQSAAFRGPAGRLFSRGGTSRHAWRWVHDRRVSFSVAVHDR